jgi:hypothetical protein
LRLLLGGWQGRERLLILLLLLMLLLLAFLLWLLHLGLCEEGLVCSALGPSQLCCAHSHGLVGIQICCCWCCTCRRVSTVFRIHGFCCFM